MSSVHNVQCVKVGHSHTGYSPITLPSTDRIFANTPTPTSILWGFPIVIRRISPSTFDNQHITWLMINADNGFAPPSWQGRLGDCYVARKDGKDLSVDVLSATIDYVSRLLDSIGDYGSINREKWLTGASFHKYLRRELPNIAEEAITSPLATAGPAAFAPAATSSSTPAPPPSTTPLEPGLQAALDQANAAKARGNAAFQAQDFHAALEYYEAGVKALTDFLMAGKGDHVANLDATKHIFHALSLNQSFTFYQLDVLPEAVRQADLAIAIHHLGLENKEMAKAYYRRGQAKVMLQEGEMEDWGVEAARRDLARAAELAPGDEGIRRALEALDEEEEEVVLDL